MKKIVLFIVVTLGLYACQSSDQKQNTEQTIDSDSSLAANTMVVTTNKLEAYKDYLSKLDRDSIEGTVKAAQKFQELFSSGESSLADSAYLIFLDYYSTWEGAISRKIEEDPSGYDSLLMEFGPNLRVRLSERLVNFKNRLEQNGFGLAWEEGIVYAIQDGNFSAKWFYNSLSPMVKEYLTQVKKEDEVGFATDGGIIIGYKDLADRTVWWEKFTAGNTNFIFRSKALERKKEYFSAVVNGMDNTPVLSMETNTLSEEFDHLYAYLISTYPQTETARLIKPYYKALKEKNNKEADRLRAGLNN